MIGGKSLTEWCQYSKHSLHYVNLMSISFCKKNLKSTLRIGPTSSWVWPTQRCSWLKVSKHWVVVIKEQNWSKTEFLISCRVCFRMNQTLKNKHQTTIINYPTFEYDWSFGVLSENSLAHRGHGDPFFWAISQQHCRLLEKTSMFQSDPKDSVGSAM